LSKETETKTEMGESITGDEEVGMNHCSYYYYYFEGLDLTLSFGRFCLKKLREEKKKKEEEEEEKKITYLKR